MAKPFAESKRRAPSRLKVVGLGMALGAVWGVVMWGIFVLAGRPAAGDVLAYLVLSTAMIGGGVAGVFGATDVKRRGERIAPRFRRRRK
ncbi:MAG: hypothetical protein AB1416_04480 [Actinomycetota bacterium]